MFELIFEHPRWQKSLLVNPLDHALAAVLRMIGKTPKLASSTHAKFEYGPKGVGFDRPRENL